MAKRDLPPGLEAREIEGELSAGLIGRQIVVLEEIPSTNDLILQMATGGAPEGLVVFAEHQSAGRGQRGNRWQSAARQGLWFSILLQPKIDLAQSARLTTWAAGTVAATIANELSLESIVKPPNDVYVAGRKVAGVLVEMRAQEHAPHLAIVGIGINVNQSAHDFPDELRTRAISLGMAADRKVDRQKFAVALLRNLERSYRAAVDL
jgi:BirA family biotin operon repressor/biotin-[acetyl-CoA-carboxylase] ligase